MDPSLDTEYTRWLETYRPLYGDCATPELFREQQIFAAGAGNGIDTASLYEKTIGRAARHALGEYFTPPELVGLVLDRLEYSGAGTLLDPSAGLGAFVAGACARGGTSVVGFEVNPLTASTARAQSLPVQVRDTLLNPGTMRFDFIAGNPPWINWRYLNPHYRERIAPLWEHYRLLPGAGRHTRLGAGMDDLSILFTYVCADRLLAPGGRLGFLLSRTLFQSAGGGKAFRRFELPQGRYLRPVAVHEIDGTTRFANATTQAVAAIFEVSKTPAVYPVSYFRLGERLEARPVSDDRASAWSTTRAGASYAQLRGPSPYSARVGAHSGGASGVFWVDVLERHDRTVVVRNRARAGRREWPEITAEIESDLVHPLVRGRDVRRWQATPSCSIILPHAENGKPIVVDELKQRYPMTFAFFEQFRDDMLQRAHFRQHFKRSGKPYWSMYNVGAYTFAPHRIVWREQCRTIECAVLENRGDIADAKLTLVACSSNAEARYLAGMLNSTPAREFVESYTLRIQISTHVLRNLRIPEFDGANGLHREMASCYGTSADALALEIWGITGN